MNMFKPVKAKNITEYIKAVPEDRREAIKFLHDLIRKTVPKLNPNFIYNMPGYGTFKYTNYKKEELDWPIIALASQKNYISLYVCAVTQGGKYLAEKYAKELGKVNVGKSCIRFKKLEDVNLPVLKKVLKEAAITPGLISAETKKKSKKKQIKEQ